MPNIPCTGVHGGGALAAVLTQGHLRSIARYTFVWSVGGVSGWGLYAWVGGRVWVRACVYLWMGGLSWLKTVHLAGSHPHQHTRMQYHV